MFVRCPQEIGGYEVQIWRQQPAGYNTGAIVGTAKTARDYLSKPISGILSNHRERRPSHVVLNGETTIDFMTRILRGTNPPSISAVSIAFKNIKIRPLP